MITFLFWNVNKNPLEEAVTRLLLKHRPEILILAESEISPESLVARLAAAGAHYSLAPSNGNKIQVFTTFPAAIMIEQFVNETGALTIRRLDLARAPSILIALVHLPSKINWSSASQWMHSVLLARDISRVEDDVGHERTILIGDLNMNPYEAGVVGAEGLNAVLSCDLIQPLRRRVVQGRGFRYFYNPMWSFFGDRTPGPPGTFYHRSPPPDSHFWNVYDQVLLRPELMRKLRAVEILGSDGEESLLTKRGFPSRSVGSDHLPMIVQLDY